MLLFVIIVSGNDALHQRVSDHISHTEEGEANAFYEIINLQKVNKQKNSIILELLLQLNIHGTFIHVNGFTKIQ